ncbi:helix-turn-helix transcriptional regulator [Brevibacterium linens]|uniref:DNA-binding response regulator, NarL/FixJ family, contains REC and HTH domains n=1 Tax=Brevibacterium linens ATCC 9172 TaxID=1255617 RepID=A0A2H1JV25_BRELN|nr:LuxR C-terminal-related transcriptional regulator [Brevibacterium linens]KAB1947150.1 helix-turn-helix transcriptional regulator [Brevibacterium linens ATCC 9172]SMX90892.1 DNA-binding response regulator, NarL/FixJ family, contains REC and HTH domains [Brevibacterium linens ATCC 9172]
MRQVIRRKEVGDLRSLLSRHRAAALTGGFGSGRRSILRALESEWDGTVIRAASSPLDEDTPLSGLGSLLAAVSASANGPSDPSELAADEVVPSMMAALRSIPGDEDTLILVPNADDMDMDSQRVLGQALRRLKSGRLHIVITVRSIDDDGPFASVPEIELADLSIAELIELARDLALARFGHTRIAEEAAQVAAHAAAGRPLAVSHILEEMAPSEMRGEIALSIPVRVGPASRPMIADYVEGLSDGADALLRCLSLSPLTPLRPLARRLPGFWEAVDELESRGTIERREAFLRIPHGFVRAMVQQSMGASERRRTHLVLAEDCADTWPQIEAWHVSFIDPGEETAQQLAAHALGLVRRGLTAGGAEFAERAIRVCDDIEELRGQLVEIAETLSDHGQFAFSRRYVRIASRSNRAAVVVRARTLEVRNVFLETQTLPSPLFASWSSRESEQAPAEVARLQLTLALCHCERGEFARAQELLTLADAAVEHVRDSEPQLAQAVRILLDSNGGEDGSALAGFASLQEHQDSIRPSFGLAVAHGLMLTEHYEAATAVLDRIGETCAATRVWKRQVDCVRAELEMRRGRVSQAVEVIDRVIAEAEADQRRGLVVVRQDRILLLHSWKLLLTGRTGEAGLVEERTAVWASATNNHRLLAELNALQGRYLLRTDCPAEALGHLRRCEQLSADEANPNVRRIDGDLIEALVGVGRREHATLLLQKLRDRAKACPSRWTDLVVGRSEALLAAGETATELFGRVLRQAGSTEFVFEKAVTHAAFASRLTDNGSKLRAREQRLAAAALFREVGAGRFADHLRTGQIVDEPEAPTMPELPRLGELSDEELKVVELVRAGLKNREISERIFVSLRTVELRLTAVYRKLDVGSRTELVSRLAGNPRLAAV